MFGTKVEEEIPDDYDWDGARPQKGDQLLAIGDQAIAAMPMSATPITSGRCVDLRDQIGQTIEVRWRDATGGAVRTGPGDGPVSAEPDLCLVDDLVLAGVVDLRDRGARVLEAAERRLGAAVLRALHRDGRRLHGGYHWTEIVFQPPLIYLFALFAVFVPVVNLHFYLVFPRPHPILVRHRRRVLRGCTVSATVFLLLLWGSMRLAGGWSQAA